MASTKLLVDETHHTVACAIKDSKYKLTVTELETILQAYATVIRAERAVAAMPREKQHEILMAKKLELYRVLDQLTLGIFDEPDNIPA